MSAELARLAAAAARVGATDLLRRFGDRSLIAESKAENDLVSAADRESEAAIIAFLQKEVPDHQILSEEAGILGPGGSRYQWIVDPLDGTNNYLQGLPIWGISVACKHGDDILAGAILDPLGDNLFVASLGDGADWNGKPIRVSEQASLKGAFLATGYPFRARGALDVYLQLFGAVFLQARSIRRCGAASLDLAYTAAGIYDGFFEFRLSAWDLAAGVVLIREAGGVVSDLSGGADFLDSGNLIAGGPAVQRGLLETVQRYASESLLQELAPLEVESS
jgi:myo-inositol-1(or 4)-monophosphatase